MQIVITASELKKLCIYALYMVDSRSTDLSVFLSYSIFLLRTMQNLPTYEKQSYLAVPLD